VIGACEPPDGAQSCDIQLIAARANQMLDSLAPRLSRISREINPYKFVRDHRFGSLVALPRSRDSTLKYELAI